MERELDRFEAEHTRIRTVRLRPGLIFQRDAAMEIRRLFVGPLLPRALLRATLFPFSPAVQGLRFQAVHSDDVGDAYRRAALSDVCGAFNIAAEPAIGAEELAELLDARPVRIPASLLRGAAAASFALRLQPSEPGWVDMALSVPLMSTARARRRWPGARAGRLGCESCSPASVSARERSAGRPSQAPITVPRADHSGDARTAE